MPVLARMEIVPLLRSALLLLQNIRQTIWLLALKPGQLVGWALVLR